MNGSKYEVELKMLRITTSHSAEGAKKYFDVSLKTSDYYTRDIGTWGGKGAERLGLKGEVERKDFVASGGAECGVGKFRRERLTGA